MCTGTRRGWREPARTCTLRITFETLTLREADDDDHASIGGNLCTHTLPLKGNRIKLAVQIVKSRNANPEVCLSVCELQNSFI